MENNIFRVSATSYKG